MDAIELSDPDTPLQWPNRAMAIFAGFDRSAVDQYHAQPLKSLSKLPAEIQQPLL